MNTIPVYIILGFLDSGKTAFIKDTLTQEYFMDGSETLIVACEEGEEEYDEAMLRRGKAKVAYVTDQAEFTAQKLRSLAAQEKPDRIFLEYNGMWPMPLLSDVLEEARLEIAQIIMIADGAGFDLYLSNMRSLIVEMLKVSDMVIFNRCTAETPRGAYKRLARAANPRCQAAFEAAEGVELSDEEELPYDVNAPVIELDDADYAIFHMDAMEKHERYQGKTVHFKAQFCKPRMGVGVKGSFIPGRFAMVCCANDIQFIGYMAQGDPYLTKGLQNRDWIEVTAQMKYERRREYNGVGPVWYVNSVKPCEKPAEEVCYF